MKNCKAILWLILTLLTLSPASSSAQFRALINLGVSGSSFRGGNLEDSSPIIRFAGGGGLRYEYPSGIEFETGIFYSVKGASLKGTFKDIPIKGVSEITYIEFPLLFGYRFNLDKKYSPRIFVGPSMAFKTDAVITFSAIGGDIEQTETDQTVESRDLGLMFGIDVNTRVRSETLSFGIRTILGFSNARSERPEIYNTSVSLQAGIVF